MPILPASVVVKLTNHNMILRTGVLLPDVTDPTELANRAPTTRRAMRSAVAVASTQLPAPS
jgi:hypothetical protein